MPRNITVTLADGTKHIYRNAPDNITPQAVQARAQREFGMSVTALDGGRSAPAPGSVEAHMQRWSNLPPAQAKALVQRFAGKVDASDPQYQALVKIAGNAPSTPAARKAVEQQLPAPKASVAQAADAAAQGESGGDYLSAVKGGLTRGLPGFEQATAALASVLPSSVSGIQGSPGYSNILEALRARTNAEMARAPVTGGLSNFAGNVAGLAAAGGAIKAGATRLAATGEGIAGTVGNALKNITTMAKPTVGRGLSVGEKAANAARIVTAGAAGGGTTAASEGGDVAQGAAGGAVGAGIVGGAGKFLSVAAQPVKAILGVSTAPQILSKFTSVTADAMRAAAAKYKAITGAEPTLFELLPPADQNKLMKGIVAGKDAVVDQATKAIAARAKTLGPDMAAKVANVVDPQRAVIKDKIAGDLAKARGTDVNNLAPEDHAMINKAMTNSTDMEALRHVEAEAHIAPHANTPVVDNLRDLFPQAPNPTGDGPPVDLDPEVRRMISAASDNIGSRPKNASVSVGDISGIMQNLRDALAPGNTFADRKAAQRALDHLHGAVQDAHPDAAAALQNSTNAYAARSRMIEGMNEGANTRLRNDVQVGTSTTRARTIRNAFDTTEGQDGLALGHSNTLVSDLGGSPADALKATVDISRGRTSRELAQNLGQDASDSIGAAALAQDESAQALARAASRAQGAGSGGDTASTMVNAIVGLHPGGFLTTKAHALTKLAHMTVVPENQAKAITEMLFSQDPGLRGKAVQALSNVPGGQDFLQSISGVAGGAVGGTITAPAVDNSDPTPSAPNPDDMPLPPAPSLGSGGESTPSDPAATPAPDANGAPSPYLDHLAHIYDTENPDVLDFTDRLAHAETSGKHFNKDGTPKISKAGAVGLMQVMPHTAPDAAREAGLPLDMHALYADPLYNKALGIGHASALLRRYAGDTVKAAAAYNAGAGAVDKALAGGGDWLARLPAETRDYVQKVS